MARRTLLVDGDQEGVAVAVQPHLVDPQLEMRISAALDRLTSGRTSVTIAHRMTTAERADVVVVVDRGRIVQQGPHERLLEEDGVYGRLWASWIAQHAHDS